MRQLVPNLCRSFTKERMKDEIAAVASGFADRLRRDKSLAVVACSEPYSPFSKEGVERKDWIPDEDTRE